MQRREMLLTTGAAILGLSAFPLSWVVAEDKRNRRYSTSTGVPVGRIRWRTARETLGPFGEDTHRTGRKNGFEVECSQNASVLDGDLSRYDLLAFYTNGMPFNVRQMQNVLDAISSGKPCVGFHAAIDSGAKPTINPFLSHDRWKLCHARYPAESQNESHFADISGRARSRRWLRVEGRMVCA